MFRALIFILIFSFERLQYAKAEDATVPALNFNGKFTILKKDMESVGWPNELSGECRYGVPIFIKFKGQNGRGPTQEFIDQRVLGLFDKYYEPLMVSAFNEACVVHVYSKASVDAKIDFLTKTIAGQMKTIEDLINKNYKSIANDPQFKEIIERKVAEALKARGL